MKCWDCGSTTHLARNCPKGKGQGVKTGGKHHSFHAADWDLSPEQSHLAGVDFDGYNFYQAADWELSPEQSHLAGVDFDGYNFTSRSQNESVTFATDLPRSSDSREISEPIGSQISPADNSAARSSVLIEELTDSDAEWEGDAGDAVWDLQPHSLADRPRTSTAGRGRGRGRGGKGPFPQCPGER